MKTKSEVLPCLLIVIAQILFLTYGCKKDNPTVPLITTKTVSAISSTSAVSGGEITSDGGSGTTARGLCWSIIETPTTSDNKTIDATGAGSFSSTITGLTPNTSYYVRAYAANSAGTGYGNELTFTTKQAETDIEGNFYTTVTIGAQVWMAENLKTTRYNDNTVIPLVTDNMEWGNMLTPGYCWYYNDASANKSTYGALYNGYAVNTGKLCPTGWHVPSQAEWTALIENLGGDFDAVEKLKESGTTHWQTDTGATNESGFTALPGGMRFNAGSFGNIGTVGEWWSSTETEYGGWSLFIIGVEGGGIGTSDGERVPGYSVRCLKD